MQLQYGSPSQAAAPALEYGSVSICVVKLDGWSISWCESIHHNLFRIVDHHLYVIPYLLVALLICTAPTKQRLGIT